MKKETLVSQDSRCSKERAFGRYAPKEDRNIGIAAIYIGLSGTHNYTKHIIDAYLQAHNYRGDAVLFVRNKKYKFIILLFFVFSLLTVQINVCVCVCLCCFSLQL